MHSLTIFDSIFDAKTQKSMTFKHWDGMEKLLYDLSKEPAYKAKKGEKGRKSSPLISPAVYGPNSSRRNVNVLAWGAWAALDVDEYEGKFEDIIESFGDAYFVCYSTASSTKEHPKFRLVFPLTSKVDAADIKHFWHALNAEYLDLGDAQTKDLSRMYYIPGQYPGAYNFIFTRKGPKINPYELMEKHPFTNFSKTSFFDTLDDDTREAYMTKKRDTLTNTKYSWSNYHDCPFVNKERIVEYRALQSGWYYKLYGIMVSIASTAVKKGYPITVGEIVTLIRQIDADTGGWYKDRPLEIEARRALEFVFAQSFAA